jgi:hypothetical protein
MDSITMEHIKSNRLLNLLFELRQEIWKYVFEDSRMVIEQQGTEETIILLPLSTLGLILVCKSIKEDFASAN